VLPPKLNLSCSLVLFFKLYDKLPLDLVLFEKNLLVFKVFLFLICKLGQDLCVAVIIIGLYFLNLRNVVKAEKPLPIITIFST